MTKKPEKVCELCGTPVLVLGKIGYSYLPVPDRSVVETLSAEVELLKELLSDANKMLKDARDVLKGVPTNG